MRQWSFVLSKSTPWGPEEVIARVLAHKEAFGITRVANVTGLDRTGIPVVMVCRPNARSSAVFNGKGLDLAAAKASGLMEAVETWHAENMRLPLHFASVTDLHRQRLSVVDIEGLPRRPRQDLDLHAPFLWVEGHDLMNARTLWLPYEIVHADWRLSGPPASGVFSISTNGLASGVSFSAAVSHALCELIERDATSLWHQSSPNAQRQMRLDLATVDDNASLSVIERLEHAEVDVAIWDITSDIGVPAFQCLLTDRTGQIGHIGIGAASRPSKAVALRHAILEAAQVRTTYIIGSREDIQPADYAQTTLAKRSADARALSGASVPQRNFHDALDLRLAEPAVEVDWLLEQLRSAGLRQAVAVDLAQSEFSLPVVRMVVPGLEGSDHHRANYAPGLRARAARERTA